MDTLYTYIEHVSGWDIESYYGNKNLLELLK